MSERIECHHCNQVFTEFLEYRVHLWLEHETLYGEHITHNELKGLGLEVVPMDNFKQDLRDLLTHFQCQDGVNIRGKVWAMILKYLFNGEYTTEENKRQLKLHDIIKKKIELKRLNKELDDI